MTDAEHEWPRENQALRDELARVTEITERALRAAIAAQDAARARHDAWLDRALSELRQPITLLER
jgi:hypothetical protein